MSTRRWPTFWEWIQIYFRLLLRHSPSLACARRVADISDEKLKSLREKVGVTFEKPLRKDLTPDTRPLPDFAIQFLDAADRWWATRHTDQNAPAAPSPDNPAPRLVPPPPPTFQPPRPSNPPQGLA